MRTVTFIGIGAQKSASTWLYGALAQFPEAFVSDPKEIDFFSSFFDRGYEWYERFVQAGLDRPWRGEVSPSYFADADAPARAQAYNPDLRVLATLRDPVERAYSNHLHEVRAGHVSGANLVFETALANNPFYLEQGFSARHLERWLTHFGRDRIHVTFQEDVKRDAAAQTARLAGFLRVPVPDGFVTRRANESMDYRNRLVGMTLWRLGRAARRAGAGGAIERLKQAPGIRTLRQANQKDLRQTVAPMREDTARRLADHFRPDVEALAVLLGQTPPWSRFR